MEDGEAFRDEGYAGAWCGAAACTYFLPLALAASLNFKLKLLAAAPVLPMRHNPLEHPTRCRKRAAFVL